MRKYNSPGSLVAPIIFSAVSPLENPLGLVSCFFLGWLGLSSAFLLELPESPLSSSGWFLSYSSISSLHSRLAT